MFLTLNSWTHNTLSIAAAQILEFHSVSGSGSMAGCQLWATIWESSLTKEGRASFELEVDCELSESNFCKDLQAFCPSTWPVSTLVGSPNGSQHTGLSQDSGGYLCGIQMVQEVDLGGSSSADLDGVTTRSDPADCLVALHGEEIRLIHGFSATRLQPEQELQFLHTLSHQGKAFVLHIVTRLQGGGGGKNPQAIALMSGYPRLWTVFSSTWDTLH